jgi:hypothetical protein
MQPQEELHQVVDAAIKQDVDSGSAADLEVRLFTYSAEVCFLWLL